MTDNLRHWSSLGKTDPRHTKSFQRAGGFKGTATKPIWTEYRLTETFGPCGIGWGIDEPNFQLVPAGDELLVYCTVRCWYDEAGKQASLYGVGGDKVRVQQKAGLFSDDEAFKKAFTDAIGNAFKHLGAGADVHMGLFEDSKYVATMRREFDDEQPVPQTQEPAAPAQTAQHPRWAEANDAYTRIETAMDAARLPKMIDELIKANDVFLALIKEVSREDYENLMSFGAARRTELLAAA